MGYRDRPISGLADSNMVGCHTSAAGPGAAGRTAAGLGAAGRTAAGPGAVGRTAAGLGAAGPGVVDHTVAVARMVVLV